MYARLNPVYWTWVSEDGVRSAFVVSNAVRYAGMLQGDAPDGRMFSRPIIEYDALSEDGESWTPIHEMRHLLPWRTP